MAGVLVTAYEVDLFGRVRSLTDAALAQYLATEEARKAVDAKVREILRERRILHQAAVTNEISAAEKSLGTNRVAEVSADAFRGERPTAEAQELAETAIEELELGLSIHRREEPWVGGRA